MSIRVGIDIGTSVYSAERVHGGSEEPLGGVVVEEFPDFTEDEFGERIHLGAAYRTIDHRHLRPDLRVDTIRASEVGDTEASPTQRLRILVRRLCQEVAMDGYKPRTGAMTAREGECVRWAWALMRSMGGPG